jgi:hypothetical protein
MVAMASGQILMMLKTLMMLTNVVGKKRTLIGASELPVVLGKVKDQRSLLIKDH